MADRLPYFFERNGAFYFRRRIPHQFQRQAGQTEWKLALGRAGVARVQVLLELRLLTETTDAAINALRRGETVSPTLLRDAFAALYPEPQPAVCPTLKEAGHRYADWKGISGLHKAEQMALDQFVAFAGDRTMTQIDRRLIRSWIDWLRKERRQSEATIRRRLGSLSAIFAVHLETDDSTLPNPFSRHRLQRAEEGYRLPFTKSHLLAIDRWLDGGAGLRATGQLIRLLRATGARPLEIGGLLAEDIRIDAPIPHLMLQPNPLRRLKTPSSRRALPLVGDGLEAARELISSTETGPVFPPACHETGSLSARLNKALRSTGLPRSKHLTAYSFRHSIEEALRVTDAPFDVQQAILGHAKRTSTERYGARHVSLARMQTALETALESLGVVAEQNDAIRTATSTADAAKN